MRKYEAMIYTLIQLCSSFCRIFLIFANLNSAIASEYSPRGVGGGGAFSGLSMSPDSKLMFVGTDMGTVFRSVDQGKQWEPVAQSQAKMGSDLENAVPVGFGANSKTLFFAESGKDPKRSMDAGVTWKKVPFALHAQERIRYWTGATRDSTLIFAGTTEGLFRSTNAGETFARVPNLLGSSKGTLMVPIGQKSRIYHSTEKTIWVSDDGGESFKAWFTAPFLIHQFTGGADEHGLTLAWIDRQGEAACAWAKSAVGSTAEEKKHTFADCGFVWIYKNSLKDALSDSHPQFRQTKKEAGSFIRMAENDSQTLYVSGGNWVRQLGSQIWISKDAGGTWALKFQIYDWNQHPYRPWPKEKLEYSAIGLDVGWNDNAPFSFAINPRNASEVGTTGHYFLHLSRDFGEHWSAPFTQFADSGERTAGKYWKSTGLEVTSALKMKFHPKNPKLAYVSFSDIGGVVTEDGGNTFRVSRSKFNTNYDYAFDPSKPDRVYAASGNQHDFPLNFNFPTRSEGGIFVSDDRGRSWKRLSPTQAEFNRQFLSVAYDSVHSIIYGGTEGAGVARSMDGGQHWQYWNEGLPIGDKVIPQIEVNPKDGSTYVLLTGNAPAFNNQSATGIYQLNLAGKWELLRRTIVRPEKVDEKYPLWLFPSSFAIDFSNPKVLWLSDIENKGAWLASGIWKSVDGGQTWQRMTQFTHPTSITLDPNHPDTLFASGLYDLSGNWGAGGALTTVDGGKTWTKNTKLPLESNLDQVTLDPSDSKKAFFLFFGGGIFYGPAIPK